MAKSSRLQRLFLSARVEPLEERLLLAAPQIDLPDNILISAGAPLHIALDGVDADGDALSYTVSSSIDSLNASIIEGNRSLRISVEDYGDMVFELFEGRAPRTTGRIIELAESGFYEDLIFHRIIDGFMIQGGDPFGTGTGGSGIDFDDEFHAELQHTSDGLLSMANSGPDTNDSQFFITDAETRWLDFNHSIFGRLTEGDDVRQAITQAPTDGNDRPLTPVIIESMEVFTDNENGVLMLSAPHGTFNQGQVTVTVSDGENTFQQNIAVSILPDNANNEPFLLPIDDVHTTVDTPAGFTIAAFDVEGDPIDYRGEVLPVNANLEIEVSQSDGLVTVTPSNGLVGVHAIEIEIARGGGADADSQTVPVLIDPAAPSRVELLSSSDTGPDDNDGITNPANVADGALKFRVYGVLAGAVVTLYADGQQIGQATASGDALPAESVLITAGDAVLLTDGTYSITAVQSLKNQKIDVGNRNETIDLDSDQSESTQITVDTTLPQFTSNPTEVADLGAPYVYDVQTNEEALGEITYRLTDSPAGMLIDNDTGQITWTPQPGQGPSQSIAVLATDAAGNERLHEFNIEVRNAPILDPIGDRNVEEGSLLTFTATAIDPEDSAAPLEFSLDVPAPTGATIDPTTGVFRWTPGEEQGPGDYAVTVRVENTAQGTEAKETINVRVEEVNTAPVLRPMADRRVDEGQLLAFTAAATDADLPQNQLTFSLVEAPAGAIINAETGRFTFTPSELQGGRSFAVTVRVVDEAGAGDEQSFTITVDEVDRPPEISILPGEKQFAAPGDELQWQVLGSDPDVPANPIEFSLEPDAPRGASLDPNTGVLTWKVPEDFGRSNVRLSVRATELIDGEPGLSSMATVEASLLDPGVIAMAESLIERTPQSSPTTAKATTGPIAPELSDVLLLTFQAPVERPAAASLFDSFPPPRTDILNQGEAFGFRIGPVTGLGGAVPVPVPKQSVVPPKSPPELGDEEKDQLQDEGDEDGQSRHRTRAAHDAILAWMDSDLDGRAVHEVPAESHGDEATSDERDWVS